MIFIVLWQGRMGLLWWIRLESEFVEAEKRVDLVDFMDSRAQC